MTARDVDEPHRVSTQLELLFDLTFVVAVAGIVAQLAHGVTEGHATEVVWPFLQVFFAIWWAWMNFTWFASSYDTDDVPYRLLTLLQMVGGSRPRHRRAGRVRHRRLPNDHPRLPRDAGGPGRAVAARGAGGSARRERSFLWGYGHYGIFAALAALGAGLEAAVRQTGDHDAADPLGTGYAVAFPTAAYLALLWVSHAPIVPRSRVRPTVLLGAAALVLAAPLMVARAGMGAILALLALITAGAVAVTVVGGGTVEMSQDGV